MPTPHQGSSSSLLGQGAQLKGDLKVCGSIRVEGCIEGSLKGPEKVLVGPTGCVLGGIQASVVEVAGRVQGGIQAEALLILRAQASVQGPIRAAKLLCEVGARWESQACQIGGPEPLEQEEQTLEL